MKIYVYPADTDGCGHFRLIWPARELIKRGHDVELVLPENRNNIHAAIDDNGDVAHVYFPKDADLLVLQRVSHRFLAQAIPMIRAQGTAVVVDMDDDLLRIHPSNPAWLVMHPRTGVPGTVNADHNWLHTTKACDAASLVTVSSTALINRYAPHGRFRVLRNCVPETYLNVKHVDAQNFGWGGSIASHPTDHEVLGRSAMRLQREGYTMRIIGDPGGIKLAYGLDEQPEASGIVPITEWPDALSTLGVGIAPLVDTQFNAAKSWLKPLEYSALGVPVVMSPRAEYLRFWRTLGVGTIANKPGDWYTKIKELLKSDTLREDRGGAAREAAAMWTYENKAEDWLEAWLAAIELG